MFIIFHCLTLGVLLVLAILWVSSILSWMMFGALWVMSGAWKLVSMLSLSSLYSIVNGIVNGVVGGIKSLIEGVSYVAQAPLTYQALFDIFVLFLLILFFRSKAWETIRLGIVSRTKGFCHNIKWVD